MLHPSGTDAIYKPVKVSGTAFKSTASSWTHLACTLSPDGTLRAFSNGIEVATSNAGGRLSVGGSSTGPLVLGDAFKGIVGLIDDIRLYGTALSGSQIASLHRREAEPEPPVVSLLPFSAWGAPATLTLKATVFMSENVSVSPATEWSVVDGPKGARVVFGARQSGALAISATFPLEGSYRLRLSVIAAGYNVSSYTNVAVFAALPPNKNQAPVVSVANSLADTYSTGAATLRTWCNRLVTKGWMSDDGLPSGQQLSLRWSVLSHPPSSQSPAVVFGSAETLQTEITLMANFGQYVLALTADDGELNSTATLTITYIKPKVIALFPLDETWDTINSDVSNTVLRGTPASATGKVFSSRFRAGYVLKEGASTGPVWRPGVFGSSLDMTGNDGRVYASISNFATGREVTVGFWMFFRKGRSDGRDTPLLSKGIEASSSECKAHGCGGFRVWANDSPDGGKLALSAEFSGRIAVPLAPAVFVGDFRERWTHVAVVFNGFDGNVDLYINGTLESVSRMDIDSRGLRRQSTGDGLHAGSAAKYPLWIGTRSTHSCPHAQVDDIAVFGWPLASDQVLALAAGDVDAATFAARVEGQASCGDRVGPMGYSETLKARYFDDTLLVTGAGFNTTGLNPRLRPGPEGELPPLSTLSPGTHPRMLFGPAELPGLRKKLMTIGVESYGGALLGALRDELRFGWTGYKAGQSVLGDSNMLLKQAFVALLDADFQLGRTIGPKLKVLADKATATIKQMPSGMEQCPDSKVQLGQTDRTGTKKCQENYQEVEATIGHYFLVAAYDLAHPFMQPEEREAVRKMAALVLRNPHAIGMNSVSAYPGASSNWIPMVTGDLIRIALVMEGEQGANPHALEELRWTYARFFQQGFLPSGASFEGAGKNSLGAHTAFLLDRHRAVVYEGAPRTFQPLLLGMNAPRNHVARWLPHRQSPAGGNNFYHDEAHVDAIGPAKDHDVSRTHPCWAFENQVIKRRTPHTHAHTHTREHVRTHTRTHAHTHAHTGNCSEICLPQ